MRRPGRDRLLELPTLEVAASLLGWRLVFQADDRTLTEAEIETAVAAITTAVGRSGGRVRT